MASIAPSNHGSISQYRCKCTFCGLNLSHVAELILNYGAVTTIAWIVPRNHWPISWDCGKCFVCGLNFLDILDCPKQPPWLPPEHHKANAWPVCVAFVCCATTVRCSSSCTPAACKEISGLVRTCPSAVMSFRNPCRRDFWARIFKSPTLERSGSCRFSPNHSGTKCLLEALEETKKRSQYLTISLCISISVFPATSWAKICLW